MPIYQTATFASADAEELGRVAADARAGFAYSRISNPTDERARRRLRGAGRRRGRPRPGLGDGRDPRRARVAAAQRRPGRRPDRDLRLDPGADAADVRRVRGPGRQRRHDRPRRGGRRARRGADEGPLRGDDRQPDDRDRRPRRAGRPRPSARRDVRRRQHVRVAVRLPAARARARTSSSSRRPSSSAVTATSSPGSPPGPRSTSARSSASQIDTGATLGPLDAFLVLRGHPDPRHPGPAPRRDRRGTGGVARASGRRVARPVSRSGQPSPARRGAAPVPPRRGRRDARLRGGRGPRRRPGDHRRAPDPGADGVARERPHDGRPPAVHLAPPVDRGGAAGRRDHARPPPRSRSGSRTSRTSRRTSRMRSGRLGRSTGGPSRRSAPSRGRSHREPGRRLDGQKPTVRPEHPGPPGIRPVAPVHVGRFRRVPDHLPARCSRSSA